MRTGFPVVEDPGENFSGISYVKGLALASKGYSQSLAV